MESTSRLTRSARARLARIACRVTKDSCEPSGRRDLHSEKGQHNWPAAFIDIRMSKHSGAASSHSHPVVVEEMAPGSIHSKKKVKYVANHMSLKSTPRKSSRVGNNEVNDSTPTGNTSIPQKTKDPQSQPLHVPSTQLPIDQTNSNSHQTNSRIPQTKPNVSRTSSPQGQSESQSNVPETQTIESEPTGDTEPYEDDPDTVGLSNKQKRKRGPTVGRGLMKSLAGTSTKMKIDVDPEIGRPRNRKQSAKFSSQIGVVARDVLPVIRKWKEIKELSALEPCMDHMQIHLDVNMDKPGVKECVIDRIKTSSRQLRHRLHKYYLRFPNMEEAKKKLPRSFSADQQEEWNSLCEHFNSPEFKDRSRKNKENRNKVKAPHGTGRTSFSVIQYELSETGEPLDAIDMYEKTHKKADGEWKTEDAMMNWEIMLVSKDIYEEQGTEITEREIVNEVLGPACGYIKGLGYGPKPPGKCSMSRKLQQQLQTALEDLDKSRSEATFFKTTVETLKEQLNDQGKQVKDQGACLSKLMALMKDGGHFEDSGRDVRDDRDQDC